MAPIRPPAPVAVAAALLLLSCTPYCRSVLAGSSVAGGRQWRGPRMRAQRVGKSAVQQFAVSTEGGQDQMLWPLQFSGGMGAADGGEL